MERENRYTVLKNKEVESILDLHEQQLLDGICRKINSYRQFAGKGILQCVVVEDDWPEYEKVWEMIAARVDGEEAPNA